MKDIIELAKQAGFPFNKYGLLQGDDDNEIDADAMFERFANLVRAETLEEAAQKCDDLWQDDGTAYDCREAIRALRSRPQITPSSGESHEDSLKSGEQARALVLADELEVIEGLFVQHEAAEELRRLHAELEELHAECRVLVRQNGEWQDKVKQITLSDEVLLRQALECLERSDTLGWRANLPVIKAIKERLG